MEIKFERGDQYEVRNWNIPVRDIMNFINEEIPIQYTDTNSPIVITFSHAGSREAPYYVYAKWTFAEFMRRFDEKFKSEEYTVSFQFLGFDEDDDYLFEYCDAKRIPIKLYKADLKMLDSLVSHYETVRNRYVDEDYAFGTIAFEDPKTYKLISEIRDIKILKSAVLDFITDWENRMED